MKGLLVFFAGSTLLARAADNPQLSSWFTVDADQWARIYRSDADRAAGRAATTWSNGRLAQNTPAPCGVQAVLSSSNWVYVLSTGLGSHVMGPWYMDAQHYRLFPNLPTDQNMIYAFPRHPRTQAADRVNHLGEIGLFVDGVRIFDANDAFSYATARGRDGDPRAGFGGDHIWNRDAFVNEAMTFDASYAHQQNWGRYHYHAEPIALRYLIGDHVDYDAASGGYKESAAPVVKHSPILGWMQDGYPIYGPYGFADATNAQSGVRRMRTGFVLRDGKNGADNLRQTGRHALPQWDSRENRRAEALAASQFGPEVSGTFPLGHYIEDYAYLGDLGREQGREFDLDECNGRWCVTPEFPKGTYAYFTTISADGRPVYPYNMGRRYHGNPRGCLMDGIHEAVTTNFVARSISTRAIETGNAQTTAAR